MDLEIVDAHPGTGGIQFPRTIAAADAGQVLEFNVGGRGRVRGREHDWLVGRGVDGGVAHFGFEEVERVGGGEGGEGGGEPGGGWGL